MNNNLKTIEDIENYLIELISAIEVYGKFDQDDIDNLFYIIYQEYLNKHENVYLNSLLIVLLKKYFILKNNTDSDKDFLNNMIVLRNKNFLITEDINQENNQK